MSGAPTPLIQPHPLIQPQLERAAPVAIAAPGSAAASADGLEAFVMDRRRLLILTGAGISTAAGIADYRDADGRWKCAAPMLWQAFSASAAARRRYWARSLVGWPRIAAATPTHAHRALARLESLGRIGLLVTQNVDGLHQRAGSRAVLDLHGRLDRVICIDCGCSEPRIAFQQRLLAINPHWTHLPDSARDCTYAPDGDAVLTAVAGLDYDAFRMPDCQHCGSGVLKPDVVFFGDSVPRQRVSQVQAALAECDGMLVVGSSLAVYSGWRFVRDAVTQGIPVAAVNLGTTRADPWFGIKRKEPADSALAFLLAGAPTMHSDPSPIAGP